MSASGKNVEVKRNTKGKMKYRVWGVIALLVWSEVSSNSTQFNNLNDDNNMEGSVAAHTTLPPGGAGGGSDVTTLAPMPEPEDLFNFVHDHPDWKKLNIHDCVDRMLEHEEAWNISSAIGPYIFCFCEGYKKHCAKDFHITKEHQDLIDHYEDVQRRHMVPLIKIRMMRAFRVQLPFNATVLALFSVVWVWGILGNGLVIITIAKFMDRNNVTNIFIMNLSISDFLVILFALPLTAFTQTFKSWWLGTWFCRSLWFVYYTSLMVSSFTMTAMAMERGESQLQEKSVECPSREYIQIYFAIAWYLVICHPMKAQYISTPSRARRIIGVVWAAALALSCVPVAFIKTDILKYYNTCKLHEGSFITKERNYTSINLLFYILAVAFLVPMAIMAFAYVRVGVTLYRSVREAAALTGSGAAESAADKQKKEKQRDDLNARIQVVKMLIMVLVVFIITWLPSMIMNIIKYHNLIIPALKDSTVAKVNRLRAIEMNVTSLLMLLTFVNSCLNPIFYAYHSKSFRRGFQRCLRRLPFCRKYAKRQETEVTTSVSSNMTASTSGVTADTTRM